jgi:uncharacterized membrane protein
MKFKYPTDRVIFFSDAVFAIAMTLLILEVKLPSVDEINTMGIGGVLVKRIPNFIGYIISFFVTAFFWKAHVQLCTLVKTVTSRFFWLNVWMLFFVVLMPFSTALYANYVRSNTAFSFYCINIALIGIFSFSLTSHVVKQEDVAEQFSALSRSWFKKRSAVAPFVFLLCIPLAYTLPLISRYGFLLIFLVQAIGDRYYNKKEKKLKEADPV